ncbi:MAG: zinc-ribbon domain-containing protein, partial [Nitrospirota bacterium]|nr:zinc-ribbon domain-containing protein [Nitrospirota bacterium]
MQKRLAPQRRSARTTTVGPKLPLSFRRPDLAREWHPTKNGHLTLDACATNSTQPVWWQCQ